MPLHLRQRGKTGQSRTGRELMKVV